MELIIYGAFSRPYSRLASARADRLLLAGATDIDWRAVEHEPTIDPSDQAMTGELADDIDRELEQIHGMLDVDEQVVLRRPPRRPNTALATRAFAGLMGGEAHRLRGTLFAALWRDGRDIGDPREVDRLTGPHRPAPTRAARWQEEWAGLEQPVTPSLVLPDGYVSRGLGALTRLADLLR